jgi:hypothetical protein
MFPQLLQLVEQALAGANTVRQLLAFWGPVSDAPAALMGPLLAVGSVLMLALLTGVSVGALATLIVALTALYLLLTEIFGISIDFSLP